jgi:hypothetical protein
MNMDQFSIEATNLRRASALPTVDSSTLFNDDCREVWLITLPCLRLAFCSEDIDWRWQRLPMFVGTNLSEQGFTY